MAQLKAIRISEANRNTLANTFNVEDPDGLLVVGQWLVTEFGVEDHFYTLAHSTIVTGYTRGRPLDRGFIEISKNGG